MSCAFSAPLDVGHVPIAVTFGHSAFGLRLRFGAADGSTGAGVSNLQRRRRTIFLGR
jgi:hypothetical protein